MATKKTIDTWIGNIMDPSIEESWDYNINPSISEEKRPMIKSYLLDYWKTLEVGPPRATATQSVEQLRAMGLVGLYDPKKSKFFANEPVPSIDSPPGEVVDLDEGAEEIISTEPVISIEEIDESSENLVIETEE